MVQTYSWETAVAEEKLPVHWGKVADVAISGEQLVSHTHTHYCDV